MEEIPISFGQGETDNIINYEPIKIKQNELEYNLNIKSNGDMITFSINIKNQLLYDHYIRKIRFNNIKELHKEFTGLKSINNFYDYLKSLSEKEKLNIKKYNGKISIIVYLEVLFKKENIEIDLFIGKQDINFNMKIIAKELLNFKEKEIYKLTEELNKGNKEINNLKLENKELNKKIDGLKGGEEKNKKIKDKEINKKFDGIKTEINLSKINIIIIPQTSILSWFIF